MLEVAGDVAPPALPPLALATLALAAALADLRRRSSASCSPCWPGCSGRPWWRCRCSRSGRRSPRRLPRSPRPPVSRGRRRRAGQRRRCDGMAGRSDRRGHPAGGRRPRGARHLAHLAGRRPPLSPHAASPTGRGRSTTGTRSARAGPDAARADPPRGEPAAGAIRQNRPNDGRHPPQLGADGGRKRAAAAADRPRSEHIEGASRSERRERARSRQFPAPPGWLMIHADRLRGRHRGVLPRAAA